MEQNQPICCPKFDPTNWQDQLWNWDNKKFIKDSVCTFFYVPLNFGRVMRRLDQKTRASGIEIPDYLCLSDHTSKWNMDVYLAVDKEVSDATNISISGTFFTRVYEGPFRDTDKWCKDYEEQVRKRGLTIKKWYMWYTTCPKCAKKYGKNYVVIVGRVE